MSVRREMQSNPGPQLTSQANMESKIRYFEGNGSKSKLVESKILYLPKTKGNLPTNY